ncbi:RAD52 motif-containing protein 1-like [Tigriopus californicus]|uniref:RAD52 motif-containing protein 1-like n=1 Tax=Tigriopus californicus TaxID=6832 RepID=UPI0027D9D3A8|nr:RAD52 motif-containing protein 1-like [Tigriopus californicus]|eukprot:TCALIF_12597-PB protein Name:"Similar to RDM1 RAD52 motif-containing protein 1 (Gallus gallus)" AED:0.51 eAED:0.51 QI:5/1/0.5/1/0/0.5/2/0/268
MMTEDEIDIELIPFQNPQIPNLYIPKIRWLESSSALIHMIKTVFSKFGLLHSVFADKSGDEEDSWFSYVTFFSLYSVIKAKKELHQNWTVNENKCSVVQKIRKSITDLPLSVRNCEELANHYLGFNGWNSKILYHRLESSPMTDGDPGLKKSVKYCTAIELTFTIYPGLRCEGAGMACQEFDAQKPEEKAKAMHFAQKHSRSAALQNAFAKVILVIVNNSKVSVEIDNTKLDPFYYDPIWEKYEVNVDDVDYVISEDEAHESLVEFDP